MAYVYAALADLKKWHDVRMLVQLTNDDDTVDPDDEDNIDEDVLQEFENAAARLIDNHLRGVYPASGSLPLTGTDVTDEIKEISAHLTWCGLWERRGDEPDQVARLRERTLARLEDMGKPGAKEVRGTRSASALPRRSSLAKVRTIFDESGYFDGLSFPGRRRLQGDRDNDLEAGEP